MPAEGERVTPAHAAAMPKIVTPNANPAISALPGAARYRLVGLEVALKPSVPYNYNLILLGSAETSEAQAPSDIIIDRCYIHGSPRQTLRRGIALNSARTVIANCWISDCHEEDTDAQAILGWNGPGPFKIENNRLEASGENICFGGADPSIRGLVCSDIEVRRNYLVKPMSWRIGEPEYAGRPWLVKNLFELKNARRLWMEGNILEYNWEHGQTGFAVLFTVRNENGGAPWCIVEDITFVNNLVRHSGSGINITGEDNQHPSQQTNRILIRNNLLLDINRQRWGGDGRMFQIISPKRPVRNLTIDRNTVLHGGGSSSGFLVLGGASANASADSFAFRDNIISRGSYGAFGESTGEGFPSFNRYCLNLDFSNNVLIGSSISSYPPSTRFVASIPDAKFIDVNGGDYRLAPDSPCRAGKTDEGAPGVDMDALVRATQGVETGVRAAPMRGAMD
ncbi:MAG: hypothetical protein BWZ10_00855 [candidate division BRC1 bacterium ADurb.BinA364]|nr:MAG: hypothetical protein BWZ10_00855 [candidate division BRC1 bacterium ADurb.BinA364]